MKTAEVQKPSEGFEIKAFKNRERAGPGVTTGRVGITSGSLV